MGTREAGRCKSRKGGRKGRGKDKGMRRGGGGGGKRRERQQGEERERLRVGARRANKGRAACRGGQRRKPRSVSALPFPPSPPSCPSLAKRSTDPGRARGKKGRTDRGWVGKGLIGLGRGAGNEAGRGHRWRSRRGAAWGRCACGKGRRGRKEERETEARGRASHRVEPSGAGRGRGAWRGASGPVFRRLSSGRLSLGRIGERDKAGREQGGNWRQGKDTRERRTGDGGGEREGKRGAWRGGEGEAGRSGTLWERRGGGRGFAREKGRGGERGFTREEERGGERGNAHRERERWEEKRGTLTERERNGRGGRKREGRGEGLSRKGSVDGRDGEWCAVSSRGGGLGVGGSRP